MSDSSAAAIRRQILSGYEALARELVPAWEALSSAGLYAPVADLLPVSPCDALDVGAGAGRDAAWFAAQGHRVVAAEPVAAFRRAGASLHAACGIVWVDDALPRLAAVRARGNRFALVTVNGVWQHLPPADRGEAMSSLRAVAAPGALLVLSLRHGPAPSGRPVFPVPTSETLALARGCGFEPLRCAPRESIQPGNRAAGVTWTWLALRADG